MYLHNHPTSASLKHKVQNIANLRTYLFDEKVYCRMRLTRQSYQNIVQASDCIRQYIWRSKLQEQKVAPCIQDCREHPLVLSHQSSHFDLYQISQILPTNKRINVRGINQNLQSDKDDFGNKIRNKVVGWEWGTMVYQPLCQQNGFLNSDIHEEFSNKSTKISTLGASFKLHYEYKNSKALNFSHGKDEYLFSKHVLFLSSKLSKMFTNHFLHCISFSS